MRAHLFVFAAAATGAALTFACSDSSESSDAPIDALDAGSAPDASQPAAAEFTVFVVEPTPATGAVKPLTGAHVVFEGAGGAGRIDAITGPDGSATLPGASFSRGAATITAYVDTLHVMFTYSGVTLEALAAAKPNALAARYPKARKNLIVPLVRRTSSLDWAHVRGAVTGKQDASSYVTLSVAGGPGFLQAKTDSFDLLAPRVSAVTLVGLEWKPVAHNTFIAGEEQKIRWARKDFPTQSGDGAFDFDFTTATPLSPVPFTGKVMLAGGAAGWFGNAVPALRLVTTEGSLFLGSSTKYTRSADGTYFDFSGEYVNLPDLVYHPLLQMHLVAIGGGFSFVQQAAFPANGMTFDGLLRVPQWPVAGQKLESPVPLTGIDPNAKGLSVIILDTATSEPRWIHAAFRSGPMPTSVTFPALPAEASALLGNGALTGQIQVEGDPIPQYPDFPATVAVSDLFNVTR